MRTILLSGFSASKTEYIFEVHGVKALETRTSPDIEEYIHMIAENSEIMYIKNCIVCEQENSIDDDNVNSKLLLRTRVMSIDGTIPKVFSFDFINCKEQQEFAFDTENKGVMQK